MERVDTDFAIECILLGVIVVGTRLSILRPARTLITDIPATK